LVWVSDQSERLSAPHSYVAVVAVEYSLAAMKCRRRALASSSRLSRSG
jgi:hypothetical protein